MDILTTHVFWGSTPSSLHCNIYLSFCSFSYSFDRLKLSVSEVIYFVKSRTFCKSKAYIFSIYYVKSGTFWKQKNSKQQLEVIG